MRLRKLLPGKWGDESPVVPVVRMRGAISDAAGPLSRRSLSLSTVAGPLAKAFAVRSAPCVAIAVNSPGGSPVQSRLIFSRIRELAKEHDKKVIVFVEDVAASGGYMIALAGDEIIADETSIVGSIGVLAAGFGFDKAIGKLGIDRRVYTAGQNKVILDPFQPEKKRDVEFLKDLQVDIHEIFIDMVKACRGEKLADDKSLFSGSFWTGRKGLELGLVDSLGHMSSVLKARYGEKTRLKLIGQKRGLFSIGGSGIASALGQSMVDHAVETANEAAARARYGL